MHVDIEFDKPRRLRFDIRAIKDLEAAMGGQPLGTIINHIQSVGVTAICAALWAGLKHEDKALNPTLVTKMLERYLDKGGSLTPLANALAEGIDQSGLFKSATDVPEEAPAGNAQAERAQSQA